MPIQQGVLKQQLLQLAAPGSWLARSLRRLRGLLLLLLPLHLLLLLLLLLAQRLVPLVLLIKLLQLLLRVPAACAVDHVLQQLLLHLQGSTGQQWPHSAGIVKLWAQRSRGTLW